LSRTGLFLGSFAKLLQGLLVLFRDVLLFF
jgi:hypothetical protein